MIPVIRSDATLAELATTVPAASRIFRREGLDYCCKGNRTLLDACRAAGRDPEALLHEIESQTTSDGASPDWSTRPLSELIEHIVRHYHRPLRRELPELVDLAEKVERVHAAKPSVPKGLRDLLATMVDAVNDHLAKEELVLFPLILAHEGMGLAPAVQVMEHEHADHGTNLARIRDLTNGLEAPPEACTTWRALYLRLAALEAELMDHIHLENHILFPRALCE